ncbi:uncharacterized protein BXZ73DRAFT_108566 [Epithele typhae]|uniref:uncharacterized protein n=1 Tax=Epithele typhae TaxID=378194 RepID=UPI002007C077|nr:uncharacterized protein BXZ73DRAFT_108566 [Epithele typhae]KAH9910728.1 hypothetical protein BXZ73DRAFT_108566 [Epithele typhae]
MKPFLSIFPIPTSTFNNTFTTSSTIVYGVHPQVTIDNPELFYLPASWTFTMAVAFLIYGSPPSLVHLSSPQLACACKPKPTRRTSSTVSFTKKVQDLTRTQAEAMALYTATTGQLMEMRTRHEELTESHAKEMAVAKAETRRLSEQRATTLGRLQVATTKLGDANTANDVLRAKLEEPQPVIRTQDVAENRALQTVRDLLKEKCNLEKATRDSVTAERDALRLQVVHLQNATASPISPQRSPPLSFTRHSRRRPHPACDELELAPHLLILLNDSPSRFAPLWFLPQHPRLRIPACTDFFSCSPSVPALGRGERRRHSAPAAPVAE